MLRLGSTVAAAAFGLMISSPAVLGQAPAPAAPAAAAAPDPNALFNTAVSSFDRSDYQAAVTSIGALLKEIPANLPPEQMATLNAQLEPIYFTLGAAYFNLKQYPEASTALKDFTTRYPKSPRVGEALFSLAQASFFAKDSQTAATSFASLENNPAFHEQALLFEGLSYKEAGDVAKATGAFEKLVAPGIKSPVAARGAMLLVDLYAKNKEPDKALKMLSNVQANIDQLENVVELNTLALEQGDAYLASNLNKEALICYRAVHSREQVIAIEQDRIAALQKKIAANKELMHAAPREASRYLIANKQIQDAVAQDQQLVDAFGKLPTIYPKVLFRMARAFYQMGKQWEAVVAFRDSYDRSQDPVDRESALFGIISAYVDVNQAATARDEAGKYLKEFPQGANAFTVGYLLGATALQENDPKTAETYFGRMLVEQPASTLREEMRFLLANAKFAQNKFPESAAEYDRYLQDFPQGTHVEEAVFRNMLAALFAGNYDDALKRAEDYLKKYPAGSFVSDTKYRRDVCKYALNKYDEVITDTLAWVKQYKGDPQQGEVEALLADAYAANGKVDEALAHYQTSFKTATTDEVLNYSIMEAGKILQKRGDWAADAAMFEDFVKTHPEHPTVVAALSQIGRAKAKLGQIDEAKQFLAGTLKKYIDDPERDSVEQILDQLAALCVRKKPSAAASAAAAAPSPGSSPAADGNTVAAAASPSPAPGATSTEPTDPGAELDELLGASLTSRTPTAQARILYVKAQLARLRRQPAEAERNLLAIAARYKPDVLSPAILGRVGDALVAKDKLDEAIPYYKALMDDYPKNSDVDFAYAGLGEIAYQKKQYQKALESFQDGINKVAANQKLKDLTVGQAKSLLELGKYDEAKKLFEQAATVREWRGETTAFCVYSLGQIEQRQGHFAEANAYYQRVFVGYQKFLPWVAKSYLASAESLEKLGKKEDAVKTLQEMLRNQQLADFKETDTARTRLQSLGAG